MPAPYAASTELDAVNQILSSVGQAPVTTLDLKNPEVAIALTTLREVNKQVQSDGWAFNTECDYEFTPDTTTKHIKYSDNILALDLSKYNYQDKYNPIRREGKFYDKYKHTYIWDDKLKADVTWLFDFDDVPPAIQYYIVARAARLAAVKIVGEPNVVKLLEEQEVQTRASAIEYDCNQADYSFFGFRDGENYYNSYSPFHTLKR